MDKKTLAMLVDALGLLILGASLMLQFLSALQGTSLVATGCAFKLVARKLS